MSKLQKSLVIPAIYHAIVFAVMAFFSFSKDLELNIVVTLLMDFAGCIVTPMFFAVASMAHAILHDGKVYDYIYNILIQLGIISAMRIVLYPVLMGKSLLLVGVIASFASLGIFVVWDCIFALTDHMMKKRPRNRNRKKQ